MGGICWIMGAGDFSGTLPMIGEGDMVIAADAGYKALVRLGVKIDRVVGDFDSLGEVPVRPGVEVHPAEKDETDMMLAVRTALAAGYRDVRIYGGLGGRLDHSFANLQTLAYLARQGRTGLAGWRRPRGHRCRGRRAALFRKGRRHCLGVFR